MKKLFVFISMIVASLAAMAQDGKTTDLAVSVNLTTVIDAVGFQFDVTMPEGIEILQQSGSYAVSLGENADGHKLFCSKRADGSYRLLCYSLTNKTFKKANGEVLKIKLSASGTLQEGIYPIIIKNIELTKADGLDSPKQGVSDPLTAKGTVDGSGSIHYDPYNQNVLGDADGDGMLRKSDAQVVVNYYLAKSTSGIDLRKADVNGDGNINMMDANAIINLYLTASADSSVKGTVNIVNK